MSRRLPRARRRRRRRRRRIARRPGPVDGPQDQPASTVHRQPGGGVRHAVGRPAPRLPVLAEAPGSQRAGRDRVLDVGARGEEPRSSDAAGPRGVQPPAADMVGDVASPEMLLLLLLAAARGGDGQVMLLEASAAIRR